MLTPLKKKIGVYQLFCPKNGKSYIGSSQDVGKRIAQHLADLRGLRHPNIHIQRVWDKHGSISFELLEECRIGVLTQLEQWWIDKTNPKLNIARCAEASARGRVMSLSQRKKMQKHWGKRKGKPVNELGFLSDSHIENIRLSMVGNQHRKGKWSSEATKKKQSESMKRWYKENGRSKEWRNRISESLKGHKVSDDTRRKISDAQKKYYENHDNPMKGKKRPDLAERNRMRARRNKS